MLEMSTKLEPAFTFLPDGLNIEKETTCSREEKQNYVLRKYLINIASLLSPLVAWTLTI